MPDHQDDVRAHDELPADAVAAVLDLIGAATGADGVAPVGEQVVLRLKHPGTGAGRHLTAVTGGRLTGYASVDLSDPAAAVTELVVHPGQRRRGLGRRLVEEVIGLAPGGRLRAWAHGDHPGARALAAATGFTEVRRLLQLRRPLTAPLPAAPLPAGVTVRAFRPGADDAAWLALNARAFATHPEQGRLTQADLDARTAESWFDPAGFLVAERDGVMVGFHWTKVHDGDEPIGEVYVLGVDPGAQGGGLGKALTVAGLEHLRGRGLDRAMLYVDADNTAAVAVYTRLGFTLHDTDVMYARD